MPIFHVELSKKHGSGSIRRSTVSSFLFFIIIHQPSLKNPNFYINRSIYPQAKLTPFPRHGRTNQQPALRPTPPLPLPNMRRSPGIGRALDVPHHGLPPPAQESRALETVAGKIAHSLINIQVFKLRSFLIFSPEHRPPRRDRTTITPRSGCPGPARTRKSWRQRRNAGSKRIRIGSCSEPVR